MQEIALTQGSPEWLEWRKGNDLVDGPRITATAASVIGGTNPFQTAHELWLEMLGRRARQAVNPAMLRGQRMEPLARAAYMKIVGEDYESICAQSTSDPWIAASLDGVDMFRTRGVEIKCPMSSTTHDMAMLGKVPEYYYDQIQWQLLSSDGQIQEIDYFSYAPELGEAKPITVKPDLIRQAQLQNAAFQFRLAVLSQIPLAGTEFETASNTYVVLNRRLKALEEQLESSKNVLKILAKGKSTTAGGAMVIVSETSGRIDNEAFTKALAEKAAMTPDELATLKETFRGKSSTVTTVKESAEATAVWEAYKATQKAMDSVSIATPVAVDETATVVSPHW